MPEITRENIFDENLAEIRGKLKKILTFFNFTAENIVFSAGEWKICVIFLIFLIFKMEEKNFLNQNSVEERLDRFFHEIGIEKIWNFRRCSKFLDEILEIKD